MHKLKNYLFVLAALACSAAFADEAGIKKIVESRIPDMVVESVHKTTFSGLYEVRAGADIFYTDDEVNFIIVGKVLDGRTLENLTSARTSKINAIPFDQLPLNQAIAIVKGKGTRKLAYFADPLCGYCKRLDAAMTKLEDVTIYVFPYPMLSPDSLVLARAVWCSANPAKAWADMMVHGIEPKAKMPCSSAEIERNMAFGRERKILGTPTLIFENDLRVENAPTLAVLNRLLTEAQVKSAEPKAAAKP